MNACEIYSEYWSKKNIYVHPPDIICDDDQGNSNRKWLPLNLSLYFIMNCADSYKFAGTFQKEQLSSLLPYSLILQRDSIVFKCSNAYYYNNNSNNNDNNKELFYNEIPMRSLYR